MGQQQLLLLVLGIVIVGLAVVVGIQAFGENQKKANADALVNDGVRIASDIQAWRLKPAAFGGGASLKIKDVTFAQIGYASSYSNLNGSFALAVVGTNGIKITGTGANSIGNVVEVVVCGTTTSSIVTAVNTTATVPTSCPG